MLSHVSKFGFMVCSPFSTIFQLCRGGACVKENIYSVSNGPIFQKYGTVKPVLNRTIMGQTFFGIQRCSVYTD